MHVSLAPRQSETFAFFLIKESECCFKGLHFKCLLNSAFFFLKRAAGSEHFDFFTEPVCKKLPLKLWDLFLCVDLNETYKLAENSIFSVFLWEDWYDTKLCEESGAL